MAEANAQAERDSGKRAQRYRFMEAVMGRGLGFLFAITGILVAAYLAMRGHDTAASVIGGTTVVAITVAFLKAETAGDDP